MATTSIPAFPSAKSNLGVHLHDSDLFSLSTPEFLGEEGDRILLEMLEDDPDLPSGLYGPMGWMKETKIPQILKEYLAAGQGIGDYQRFHGLDAEGAQKVLTALPRVALADRQNDAPSLLAFLNACIANPGRVYLSGYVIGSSRWDERVSVDTMFVVESSAEGAPEPSARQARKIWQTYQNKLALGQGSAPDELYSADPKWACPGWCLWWD
ncbi:hypothetical protein [Varibaculum vaginae]|uniref:hypothetical protein n=1 Tax=Varibaculum vaginae TaxID=2364797 RepID=UPI000F0955F3|nr:hypothetical protein [Varibaculum vaginae]